MFYTPPASVILLLYLFPDLARLPAFALGTIFESIKLACREVGAAFVSEIKWTMGWGSNEDDLKQLIPSAPTNSTINITMGQAWTQLVLPFGAGMITTVVPSDAYGMGALNQPPTPPPPTKDGLGVNSAVKNSFIELTGTILQYYMHACGVHLHI